MKTAAYWIEKLRLQPHPEGGFYRETYRSSEQLAQAALPSRFPGPRSFSTAIYFLLEGAQFSAFHRIRSDELWHFYDGNTLVMHLVEPNGKLVCHRLGANPVEGDAFQVLIPAGTWFAAEMDGRTGYALVGCTVTPGFDFADFELGSRSRLLQQFSRHAAIIEKLTRA